MFRRLLVLIVIVLGLLACSDDANPPNPGLQVVATTNILADVVGDLVGEHGSVEALMEAGVDPHDFTPSAEQAASLRSADLVVANGLGLEEGLADMLESAAQDGAIVMELAPRLDPLPLEHHAEEATPGDDHDHEKGDPHFVLDPLRVADAVDIVASTLTETEPSVSWRERADRMRSELEQLHRDIEEQLSSIPPARRKLVTSHDSLRYFADRYDFEVVGTVIPGGSTLAEPSASDLAELADLLRREGVTAIFADTSSPVRLAETVAAEIGGGVEVYHLYTESVGPEGSEASTYAGMMRANAATIAAALGS